MANTETVNVIAPHCAVILVRAEIMEKNKLGVISGKPLTTVSQTYCINGNNYKHCLEELEIFFNNIQGRIENGQENKIQEDTEESKSENIQRKDVQQEDTQKES